ncbi:hypothetical protein HDU97_008547 [Phlyctochytrium planicorne]|nr:hypothetical protein HDU97_008547 [Phlyctochytrium planicorne]
MHRKQFNWEILAEIIPPPNDLKAELDVYLMEKIGDGVQGSLTYWRSRREIYPKLSMLARVFLSILVFGVAGEKAFLEDRHVLDDDPRCADGDGELFDILYCLKEWMNVFDEYVHVDRGEPVV